MLQLTNVRDLDTNYAQNYKYHFSIFLIFGWLFKCRGYCFNICFIGIGFKYILFSSVGNIIYEHIEGVSFLCNESF